MNHTRWQSKRSFIFATAASAVGLGNIWRFPYLVAHHGAGAYVLVYLLAVLVLGLPLLFAEAIIGRTGRGNPIHAIRSCALKHGRSRYWCIFGGMGVLSGFLIVSYYCVITGWVGDYLLRAVGQQFHGINAADAKQLFTTLKHSPWRVLISDTLVFLATAIILMRDIQKGLEPIMRWMFPLLLIMLCGLFCTSFIRPSFAKACHYLFVADFSTLSVHDILSAIGQAFFSLNIGVAITMMFSAYLPDNISLPNALGWVAISDTGIALVAGLIIFPITLQFNLADVSGPGLIFQSLPVAFGHMAGGSWLAVLFFLLLFFAAFSSVITLLEPTLAWLTERFQCRRSTAALGAIGAAWLLSLLTIASFSSMQLSIGQYSIFEWIDKAVSHLLLPLGGIGIALFVGWCLPTGTILKQLSWRKNQFLFQYWRLSCRTIAPLAVIFIILQSFWSHIP